MNAQSHRLIFNKARGCLMAVGEHARSSAGGGCSGSRRRKRPGVALSAEQMAQLTSDIVWLVEQTVTLADVSCPSVRNIFAAQLQARFFKEQLLGAVFDGVVGLLGAALCLLFMQIQAITQALPLFDADSAV